MSMPSYPNKHLHSLLCVMQDLGRPSLPVHCDIRANVDHGQGPSAERISSFSKPSIDFMLKYLTLCICLQNTPAQSLDKEHFVLSIMVLETVSSFIVNL